MSDLATSSEPTTASKGRQIVVALITLGIIALTATVLIVWRNAKQNGAGGWSQAPVQVSATQVQMHEIPQALNAIGSLTAVKEVTLAPEVEGRVVQLAFASGAQVKQGDLLLQLFDAPEQADLNQAKAALQLAQVQVKRSKQLAPIGALAKETLDERISSLSQNQARVQQLQARIVQKQIRAPFSGTLGVRKVDLGEYLVAGQAVVSLTDLSQLYVNFSLPQQALSHIQLGASVVLTSDAYPEQQFSATLNAIEPRIDQATRNIQLQALLDNRQQRLRPGMFVDVALQLPKRQALVLPATAVQIAATGDSVLVIRGDEALTAGTAEAVAVTVGQRSADWVVIEHGLQAGDVVIAQGQLKVQPGAPVQVSQLMPVTVE